MNKDLEQIEVMNDYDCIDDLPFTSEQKMMVLAWFARKLWAIDVEALGNDYCGKVYDPLSFWEGEAHSYVFDLEDGGRHHKYDSLGHLEAMLVNEIIGEIDYYINGFDTSNAE